MNLSPETEAAIEEGVARFNEGLWWEAHESWERAWNREEGDLRLFLQGLIQLAAALHKGHVMKNPAGACRLFAAARDKLGRVVYGGRYAGFEMGALLAGLDVCFSDAAAVWRGERKEMDRALAPRLARR